MKLRMAAQTKSSQLAEQNQTKTTPQLPKEYQRHAQVFSEQKAQRFPESRPWDHAIELKKDAPSTLPRENILPLPNPNKKCCRNSSRNTCKKRIISVLQRARIHRPLLLHQEERQKTSPCPGLQTNKQMDDKEPLSTAPHPRTYQSSQRRHLVLQVRRPMGVQQRPNQKGR